MGGSDALVAVGVWPETGAELAPVSEADLDAGHHLRRIARNDVMVGALTAQRDHGNPLSLSQERLLDDLAGQAALVLDNVTLAGLVERERTSGHLDRLTAREREVLELMARGLSNAAICDELHLSVKTVEPVVSSIFAKLGLHQAASSNRRVLAVVEYLRTP